MSAKEADKRARERIFLNELLRHVPGLRFIEHGEPPEWPDFVVADDRGPMGIELTQLFCDDGTNGSPTAAEEGRRTKCLQEIARRYYAAGGPPAQVTAVYLDHRGRNIDDAVRLLLKASARPGEGPHAVRVPDRSRRWQRPWADLHLLKLPAAIGAYCDWTAVENSSGWVRTIGPDVLRACIEGKAANLPRYRRHLERLALLIYVELYRGSGMIEPQSDRLLLPAAGFEAVYLLLRLRVGAPELLRIDTNQGP